MRADISFEYLRILGYLCVWALSQYRAARKDRYGIRQLRDDVQVMLHHHDGSAGSNFANQVDNASDILMTHALGRLVEQHKFRVERECRGDFESPLATIRQLNSKRIRERGEIDCFQQLHRACVEPIERAGGLP